ncbi:hypothetical protein [Flavilitoribacter nigricans]|nr:hypothetical protein [Flavilitoribacter nigricans]
MRERWFFNDTEGTSTGDSGGTTTNPDTTPTTDDPGRTDTDTIPKKKAE